VVAVVDHDLPPQQKVVMEVQVVVELYTVLHRQVVELVTLLLQVLLKEIQVELV
tara:strand:- start:330 stop:491 length:162 start_codon:yes stop_codon:yes gene_type:complete